ncbi:MAG: hypothetical protein ACRDQ7_27715 [Haloechinothrix sp.]
MAVFALPAAAFVVLMLRARLAAHRKEKLRWDGADPACEPDPDPIDNAYHADADRPGGSTLRTVAEIEKRVLAEWDAEDQARARVPATRGQRARLLAEETAELPIPTGRRPSPHPRSESR